MSNDPIGSPARAGELRLYPEQMEQHRREREANLARARERDPGPRLGDGPALGQWPGAGEWPGARDAARNLARLGARRAPPASGCVSRAAWKHRDASGATTSVLGATVCQAKGRTLVTSHLWARGEPLGGDVRALAAIGEAELELRAGRLGHGARGSLSLARLGLAHGAPPKAASASDERGAVTVRAGYGAGLLYRSEDVDGDGRRERGVTLEAGPASAQLVSEDWARTLLPSLRGVDAAKRAVGRALQLTLEAIGKR